jgi:glutamate/tyrosine decarboxylase-like PLP-dependent enzyme
MKRSRHHVTPAAGEVSDVIDAVAERAAEYLAGVADDPVVADDVVGAARRLEGERLPEDGRGAKAALEMLFDAGIRAATRSSGPRFFHFVTGGTTPAALGADWLATVLDQNALGWVGSPLATTLESVSIAWLKELFVLPPTWGGVLTTGATMANFVALASARRWYGEQHGTDIEEQGLAGLPQLPVFSSGYIHPSALKALAMLGVGRSNVRTLTRDAVGRLDDASLEDALRDLGGRPSIVVANAGEVNAGDFDPIARVADLCERYGAWLHVDGAFGLFARVSPRTAHLADGVERAHSVIADAHKWLNVPYESGFAFVRDAAYLPGAFSATAAYLTKPDDPRPSFMYMGPEMSRRARSLPIWATLYAYGRRGYRSIVEHHLDLAQHARARVDESPDLERMADVPFNIVCFRFRPRGVPKSDLDDLNRRLGEAILTDGRVYVGTTVYDGRVAFRPAFVNWRTAERDVDALIDVVLELGQELPATRGPVTRTPWDEAPA